MRNKPIFLYFIITLVIYISYSAFIRNFILPDLGFIVMVFVCLYVGPSYSSILGFLCGLNVDILSISPLGFHCFIYATIGYLLGKFKGKIFVDPILVPALIVFFSVVMKTVIGYLLLLIIGNDSGLFFVDFWEKLFFSCISGPFLYFALRFFHLVDLNEKD